MANEKSINFFGGEGPAGGSVYAEADRVAEHLRAVTWGDDERVILTGHQARRIAFLLTRIKPCLTCGGDGVTLTDAPCPDCAPSPERTEP